MAGPATPGGRVTSPALVGRADELERLAAAVTAPPVVVVLEGEAGVGKSRLVSELRDRVPGGFLVGGCQAIREPFPLGPVLDAVRGAVGGPVRGAVGGPSPGAVGGAAPGQPPGWDPVGLSPVVGALRPLLPELAPVLPPLPDPLEDRVAERHRVLRGLVELLRALGPVTLVLEDLHWADEQTVDFLRYLVSDPPGSLSLVVTFRAEEVDPAVPALMKRLPPPVGRTLIALPPLDTTGTGELAAALAGVERVSDDFAGYLRERTGGLPFAIEEVMALLRERGQAGGWAGRWSRRMLDELAVPAAIRD
ncbi:MAG: AAA family ATPase, partial [Natronosporangium sp.]